MEQEVRHGEKAVYAGVHPLRHLVIAPITTIKILTVAPELRSGRAWVLSKRLVIWKNDGLLRL
jgi:hypothetical protein